MITTHWMIRSARQVRQQLSAHAYSTMLLRKTIAYKAPPQSFCSDPLRSVLEERSLMAAKWMFLVISEVWVDSVSMSIIWLEVQFFYFHHGGLWRSKMSWDPWFVCRESIEIKMAYAVWQFNYHCTLWFCYYFLLISSVEFIHFLGHILIIVYILKLKKTLSVSEFMLCNDSHNLMSSVYLDIGFRIPTSACSCYNLQTFMSLL